MTDIGMTPGELAATLSGRLAQAPKLGYRVKFLLEEGGIVFWDGTGDRPQISDADGEADTVIRLSAENFAQLMDGKLDPTLAYMTGKLKVEGKLGVAMKINAMLSD
jgi:putative sterol carrier protein